MYAITLELALDPVRQMAARSGVTLGGYLDDGVVSGPAGAVAAVLREMADLEADVGQVRRPEKCRVLSQAELPGHTFLACPGGAVVVGVPVGTDAFRRNAARAVCEEAVGVRRRVAERVPQAARLYLLRKADGWPVVQHIFRSTPAPLAVEAVALVDEARDVDVSLLARLTPSDLRAAPLYDALGLPSRVGGRAVQLAACCAPAARIAGAVQAARTLRAMDRLGADPECDLAGCFPSLPGRPLHGVTCARPCQGAAQCGMRRQDGCPRDRCSVCCVLAVDACAHCCSLADAACGTPDACVAARCTDDVAALARAVGASSRDVCRAAALAARYDRPQRALTCAAYARLAAGLVAGSDRLARATLRSMASVGARAVFDAAPVPGAAAPSADALMVAIRSALGVRVLPADVRPHQREKVGKCLPCGCAVARASDHPDLHARICKAGDGPRMAHDSVMDAVGKLLNEWGLFAQRESRRYLPGKLAIDLFVPGAGTGGRDLAVDFTRSDVEVHVHAAARAAGAGAAALIRSKTAKYLEAYRRTVDVGIWATDHLGGLAPEGARVIDQLVQAAAHVGGHPDDLRRELLCVFSVAMNRELTGVYARAAAAAGAAGRADVPHAERAAGPLRVRPVR